MRTPERSPVIARALSGEAVDLPADFAKEVAALAEARARPRHRTWHDVALVCAFIAMLGLCVAGWVNFAPEGPGVTEWLAPIIATVESQPWLVMAAAAIAIVQMLTFSRRARTSV